MLRVRACGWDRLFCRGSFARDEVVVRFDRGLVSVLCCPDRCARVWDRWVGILCWLCHSVALGESGGFMWIGCVVLGGVLGVW